MINKARREKLRGELNGFGGDGQMPNFIWVDPYFELLPLKPPGEPGKALIQHFEPADQSAADEVGREAKNEKEIDSFQCAMNWED